jgi:hypothetical protein
MFAIAGDTLVVRDRWRRRFSSSDHALDVVPNAILSGPYPVIVEGRKAYRLTGGRLRELPVTVSGDPQAVDAAGRIWTIACGRPRIARRVPDTCSE